MKFIRYNLSSNKENPRIKHRDDKSLKEININISMAEGLAKG